MPTLRQMALQRHRMDPVMAPGCARACRRMRRPHTHCQWAWPRARQMRRDHVLLRMDFPGGLAGPGRT